MKRNQSRYRLRCKNGPCLAPLAPATPRFLLLWIDEQLSKTIEFRSGNYSTSTSSLSRKQTKTGSSPLGRAPIPCTQRRRRSYVVVQNKTSALADPGVRDLTKHDEFIVKDEAGNEIYHRASSSQTACRPRATALQRPVTDQGEFVDNHKVFTIHSVAYDNTVRLALRLVRYQFRVPPESKAPSATAKINYRHLRQSYLNNIFGKDHPAYPVVELTSRTRKLNIGGINRRSGPGRQPGLDALEQPRYRVARSVAVPESVQALLSDQAAPIR